MPSTVVREACGARYQAAIGLIDISDIELNLPLRAAPILI
jgi:hypothetical protein